MYSESKNHSFKCSWLDHSNASDQSKILNGLAATLSFLSTGVILLNNIGRVIYINEAAQTIVNKNTSLKISAQGVMSASFQSETSALKRVVEEIVNTPDKSIQHISLRDISSTKILTAGALHLQTSDDPDVPCAVIYIVDQDNNSKTPNHVFQGLYGLTKREAELASAIAKGMRVTEYAQEQSVSLNTVNSQLKSIMSKTNTSRQSDLVRLFLTSVPILALQNSWA